MDKVKKLLSTAVVSVISILTMLSVANAQSPIPSTALAWSPNGQAIAHVTGGQLQIVDAISGQAFTVPTAALPELILVTWNPDSSKLAVTGLNSDIFILQVDYETHTSQILATLSEHEARVDSLAWNHSGDFLASTSWEEPYNLRIWNMGNYQLVVRASAGNLYDAAWNPMTDLLAITSIGGSYLFYFDLTDTNQLLTFERTDLGTIITEVGPQKATIPVVWHPNGQYLAIGDYDGIVHIVDTATNSVITTLDIQDIVTTLTFSADGQYLAASNRNDLAIVWDWTTGNPLKTIHNDIYHRSFAFSPDSTQLAYGTADGTLKIVSISDNSLCTPTAPTTPPTYTVAAGDTAGLIAAISAANANPDPDIIALGGGVVGGTLDIHSNASGAGEISDPHNGCRVNFPSPQAIVC